MQAGCQFNFLSFTDPFEIKEWDWSAVEVGPLDPVAKEVVLAANFSKDFEARASRAVHDGPIGALGALDAAGIIQRHLDTVSVSFLNASNVPWLAQEVVHSVHLGIALQIAGIPGEELAGRRIISSACPFTCSCQPLPCHSLVFYSPLLLRVDAGGFGYKWLGCLCTLTGTRTFVGSALRNGLWTNSAELPFLRLPYD